MMRLASTPIDSLYFRYRIGPMPILQRAIQTMMDAEAALKRLIGEAAERGEYALVEKLAKWASGLGAMCSEEQQVTRRDQKAALSHAQNHTSPTTLLKRKAPLKTSGYSKRRAYPVFAKSGDVLVKIAWSKSSKSEYQHKSPRMVIRILATSLAHQARDGAIVSMDKILPLKAEDGSEISNYQVYVSLAWLRKIEAVKQNGRQGYTVMNLDAIFDKIDAAWSGLPEVKGR